MDKSDLILKLLEDFRTETNRRFDQVDKRFAQVDKRFERIEKQFEQIDTRFDRLEAQVTDMKKDIRSDRDKLQEVYEARDRVAVSFTRSWATASLCMALLASTIVLAVSKAF